MTRNTKTLVVTRGKFMNMDAFIIRDMHGEIVKVYPFRYRDRVKLGYDTTVDVSLDFFTNLSILQYQGYNILF